MAMPQAQMAKVLGITPAYLSYMVNGKRPWRHELHKRYRRLVNAQTVNNVVNATSVALAAPPGFEPGLEDSKSSVLPLHNGAVSWSRGNRRAPVAPSAGPG